MKGQWAFPYIPDVVDVLTGNEGLPGDYEERKRCVGTEQERAEALCRMTANAHLIAAAPEMLAALQRVLEPQVFLGAIADSMVHAAIAKAEGLDPILSTLSDFGL